MQRNDHRRSCACGELSIMTMRRFLGGWFLVRCPNCQCLLRLDPPHGQRWMLLTAFGLVGAAAIAGAALIERPIGFIVAGTIACALLYAWEFALTHRSPLEAVTAEDTQEFRRIWLLGALATLAASVAIAFAATRW